MSTNLQDYVELLNAEQHVQVDKLRGYARHGVAPSVRGEVWMYLLQVLMPEKTTEVSFIVSLTSYYSNLASGLPSSLISLLTQTALEHHTKRFFNPTYAGLITSLTAETTVSKDKSQREREGVHQAVSMDSRFSGQAAEGGELNTLRSQYSRFLPPTPTSPPSRNVYIATVLEVLGKYYHIQQLPKKKKRQPIAGMEGWERDWVYLVTPFICCLARPAAMCLGFEKLMDRIDGFPPLPSRLASLLTLFRLANPELHSYFEDEQVPYIHIVTSWSTTFFSKEMWLGDLLRLWDAYIASEDMFELHCYVSVAILNTLRETLEELDGSEAKLVLLDLPPMDVDQLLQDAANLQVSFPLPRPVLDDE